MSEEGQVDPVAPTVEPAIDPVTPVVDPVTEPVTAPAVEPAGQSTPSIVNEKGEFSKDWTNQLEESLKSNETLKTFVDVQTLAKSYVHLRNNIGKDKITMPNENSTNEEWSEFYSAAGRPDTAEDYNITRPVDMPEELFSDDLAKAAQKLFFDIGLSPKQANALMEFNTQAAMQASQNQNNDNEMAVTATREGLEKEWGSAYDQRKHWGNLAIDKACGGNQDFQERLIEKFGSDPDFIRFASNLGGHFVEHGAVLSATIDTPADISQKISEAMKHPAYNDLSHPDHNAKVNYVQSLFAKRAEGRTVEV